MWLLIFIFLFNSAAHGDTIINAFRFEVAGTPLGANDFIPLAALIASVLLGGKYASQYPNSRTHPTMVIILVLMCLGLVAGVIGALMNNVEVGLVLRGVREQFAWIICIIAGYRLLPNPKGAAKLGYIVVISGVLTATGTIYAFVSGSDDVAWGKSWNAVRTAGYVTSYITVGCGLAVYSVVNLKCRLFPASVTVLLVCYMILGLFAPMTRGEWLGGAAVLFSLILLIRSEYRLQLIYKSAIIAPLILATFMFGIWAGGRLTGKNFANKVWVRIESLLPSTYTGKEGKAWDTRLGSIQQELDLWLESPIFGKGLGIQTHYVKAGNMADTGGYNHNGWASMLAKSGIFGFSGYIMIPFALMVIGRRIVRETQDRGSIMIGAISFFSGVYLVVAVLTTMIWSIRNAMLQGLIAGMMFRVRDWQETTQAIEQAGGSEDETWLYEHGYYDSEGGWLSPGQS